MGRELQAMGTTPKRPWRVLLIIASVLLGFAFVAPVSLVAPIGPFLFVPLYVVFGGVNVAAIWAAVGPGTSGVRQLSTAIFAALLACGFAVASVAALGSSRREDILAICAAIGVYFFVAQIPFSIAREVVGYDLPRMIAVSHRLSHSSIVFWIC